MTHYFITELESDAELLRERLYDAGWKDVKVISRGSKMGAISYGKTISVNLETPVAVVLNPETDDEDRLQLIRSEFQDLVSPLPNSIAPVLMLPVPSIANVALNELFELLEAFLADEDLSEYRYTPRP
jgi:hypothetical protein